MANHVHYGPGTMRKCSKCGIEYPLTTEHFHRHQGGLRPDCKHCRSKRAAERYQDNRDAYLARNRAWKAANPDKIKAQVQRWVAEHPERRRRTQEEWRKQNRDVVAGYARNWRASHRETANAADRAYRERTRDTRRQQAAQLRSSNRDRYTAYQATRRARQLAAGGQYTAEDIQALHAAQDGRCRWCSEPLNGGYDVDHIIPLSRGGTNEPINLALACASCNRQKSNRLVFDEWTPPNPLPMTD